MQGRTANAYKRSMCGPLCILLRMHTQVSTATLVHSVTFEWFTATTRRVLKMHFLRKLRLPVTLAPRLHPRKCIRYPHPRLHRRHAQCVRLHSHPISRALPQPSPTIICSRLSPAASILATTSSTRASWGGRPVGSSPRTEKPPTGAQVWWTKHVVGPCLLLVMTASEAPMKWGAVDACGRARGGIGPGQRAGKVVRQPLLKACLSVYFGGTEDCRQICLS